MKISESERLILRVLEPKDVQHLERIWGDDEVMRLCTGATSHEKFPRIIEYYKECQAAKGLSVYAVVEKISGNVVGTAGFNVEESMEKVELIYHFAIEAWGKGYASEAAWACVEIAKAHKAVSYVFASADPNNKGSLKVLEKVGFDYKGMKWFEDTNQEEPYYELTVK
ncbi:GNAT family N-acetyltransferase [Bacillus sp. RO2]|uniref:GNAT family N-acetyltransferase n=1 Tax=Bacillus sp. RO2 TaxID=2723913 RepID=UPI00145E36BE|nr:GNAT family N-acetyltransferase [Bacillus sp. RO2]NMH71666.1 GNAT family N-acetyltransferase [Bacillus sp. RO2]